MQLFAGGDEFAKKKDIVNPNLLDKSKSFIVQTPAGAVDCGKFIKYSKQNAGSIYLSQIQINSGFADQGTTYFLCEPNTYYTQSLWLTSSVELTTLEKNQMAFQTNQYGGTDTINQKIISLGNNQYKIIGSFYSGTTINNFDIGYIKNFQNLITADANIRFDALKIEKGTIPTTWCPAYEDCVMKSDLEDYVAKSDYVTCNITENVMSWEPNTMYASGKNNTLSVFPFHVPNARYTSKFIKVYPNETVSVEVNPLANKNFLWMYYLVESPQTGSKVYNPSADWENGSSATFNTGNAKYIIFLVGNDAGFTGVNTWELKFKHNFNLIVA